MAGNIPDLLKGMDSDQEEDEVFMGPITKRELLAPIKITKKPQSLPRAKHIQVSTPRVIDSINLVTPIKSSTNNTPLDLSFKKSSPVVVDLSTPAVSKTIPVPDTPRSILNESDFMDESDMGISVDSVLVDLSRDIEAEMEIEMRQLQNGFHSQNQSLQIQSFFNSSKQNGKCPNINLSHTQGGEKNETHGNATRLSVNGSTQITAFNTTVSSSINTSQVNGSMNSSQVNGSMNTSQMDGSMNTSQMDGSMNTSQMDGSMNKSLKVSPNKSNGQILNETTNKGNLSQRQSLALNMSSQNASELNSTEEQSLMSSKDLSTEESNPHQEILSDSFQYYSGPDLANKENDLNQSNHMHYTSAVKEEDPHLNATFEKLSVSHSHSVLISHATNPAEDTLEEIDILETYGYKTADNNKLIIPTINILSATATTIEESDLEDPDHETSTGANESKQSNKQRTSIQSISQQEVKDLNKSSNEINDPKVATESVIEVGQNMSTNESHVPTLDQTSDHTKHVQVTDSNMEQDESVRDISQMMANTSIQTKAMESFKADEEAYEESSEANKETHKGSSKANEEAYKESSKANGEAEEGSKDNEEAYEESSNGETYPKERPGLNEEAVAMETSVNETQNVINVMCRDSYIGHYETVNVTQGEACSLLSPPCPDFNDEDDLNRSIIDNTDATNHWKEVNTANNTYIDLSPIKKNASGGDYFTEIHSDHTYAHGEPSGQAGKSESSNSEDELVQDIFVNTTKKLLSIVEESEADDGVEQIHVIESGDNADVSMQDEDIDEIVRVTVEKLKGDKLNETFIEEEETNAKQMSDEATCSKTNETSAKDNSEMYKVAEAVVVESNTSNKDTENLTSPLSDEGKADVSVKEKVEQSLLAESMKKAMEQMEELNQDLNSCNDVHEKSSADVLESKAVSATGNETINTVNIEVESTNKTLDREEIPAVATVDQTSVLEQASKDQTASHHIELSEIKEEIIDKTQGIADHCNNTALRTMESKDECDFKSVVLKYEEEHTGVSLSTTEEYSFAPESFSKYRHVNDDLNTFSPDLEANKKDTKKSTIKPSQIPMSRRTNVLRPTKFTSDNIKVPPKPLAKVKSAEKIKQPNGSLQKSQKENLPKKVTTSTPSTPSRSISQALVSTFSSLANKITGRTPRKETTTSKIKSPEPPKHLKSPRPVNHLKSPKPSSAKPNLKSPNASLAPSTKFTDKAFSPILARFRNVPSSTPAVKNMSKTPTPRSKVKTPGPDDSERKQGIRKSLSASKVEGQNKSAQTKFDLSLNNRKLDFKNVESKIGSIRKPDEIPALQKAVKSPISKPVKSPTPKPSLIKPPKFTGSKLPTSLPTKRPSKFLNVQSPIGAYIRDGSKAMNESKRSDSSSIPRKLQKLNPTEGQITPKAVVPVSEKLNEHGGNSVPVSADVSMSETPLMLSQDLDITDTMQHTAL
ncbi:hypothetical protein M8J75_015923 [Diaphorina citri]|nr:hypothetical protein M8J75_015923 [Diaphorina citri]